MIGQYLSNNNETATIAFRQKICPLNSPLAMTTIEQTKEAVQLNRISVFHVLFIIVNRTE
jgi:hypothetical protein